MKDERNESARRYTQIQRLSFTVQLGRTTYPLTIQFLRRDHRRKVDQYELFNTYNTKASSRLENNFPKLEDASLTHLQAEWKQVGGHIMRLEHFEAVVQAIYRQLDHPQARVIPIGPV